MGVQVPPRAPLPTGEVLMTVFEVFAILVASLIYSELVGYGVHILLHSEKVPFLSRSHMIHHLKDYGPGKPLHRKGEYLNSAAHRSNFLGNGLEWVLPGFIIVLLTIGFLTLFGVHPISQAIFIGFGMIWVHFMFGSMHSAMHMTEFWMEKVPVLCHWYKSVRKKHDLHHLQISDDGRMLKNYGICFFWFDRIFGSYTKHSTKFNEQGYRTALVRYEQLINS